MIDFIKNKVKSLEEFIVSTRRDLHKHPESAWTEFRTSAFAIQKMQSLGYSITMGAAAVNKIDMMGVPSPDVLKKHQKCAIEQGADVDLVTKMEGGLTGFWADMKFSDHAPKVALRFDMDSNDVTECKELTHRPFKEGFASINKDAMHACGHDAHVAIGLAVAEIVASMKQELKGSIRFIFQPGEEGLRGAAPMVAAGAVHGVDYIIGMHVGFQAGKKGDLICGAKGFLASTKWDVVFTGLAAHAGAAPQEGKNALLAACTATLNLHAISRHGDGVTRVNVGKLSAGVGRNVIAPNALLVMETRGGSTQINDYMVKEAGRIVKAAAQMYDCSYEISLAGGTASGESSVEMIEKVFNAAAHIPSYTNITKLTDFGAGEDFALMMSKVQASGGIGSYIQVGTDRTSGHHTSTFDFDESDLFPATELASICVFDLLKK